MKKLSFLVNGIFPVYFLEPGQSFDAGLIAESFAYVIDARGWSLFKRNCVTEALVHLEELAGLPQAPQFFSFQAHKLSLKLIQQVTAFFKAVYQRNKSEAVGYLLYEPPSGDWDFVPPPQTATGASADYGQQPKRDGWIVAGTIHSHGSMSAFHSGTDHDDEAHFDGVHITIGRVNSVPEYSCSFVVQGKRTIVEPCDLIEGMAPMSEVPAGWMDAIKLPKPSGLAPLIQAKAETLYQQYFRAEISENTYLVNLKKFQEENDRIKTAYSSSSQSERSYDDLSDLEFEEALRQSSFDESKAFELVADTSHKKKKGKKGTQKRRSV